MARWPQLRMSYHFMWRPCSFYQAAKAGETYTMSTFIEILIWSKVKNYIWLICQYYNCVRYVSVSKTFLCPENFINTYSDHLFSCLMTTDCRGHTMLQEQHLSLYSTKPDTNTIFIHLYVCGQHRDHCVIQAT